MTVATKITGSRADSTPVRWLRPGQTFAKADWNVTAQVRRDPKNAEVIQTPLHLKLLLLSGDR